MTKLKSQLLAVERAMPFERMVRGKTSPDTAQPVGPQVEAKKKMYTHTKAMRILCAASLPPVVVPTMATMNSQIDMPTAPQMRRGRRPQLSMVQRATGVDATLTVVASV